MKFWLSFAFAVFSTFVLTAAALEQGSAGYLRLDESHGEPIALQVSVTRFTNQRQPDVEVDLVSAVHVGDAGYYLELNQRFTRYDAVLFELVAEPETRLSQLGDGTNKSSVSRLQNGLKNFLELAFQLELVDYSPANFVHADLTPKQFSASMEQRGESLFLLAVNTWLMALSTPGAVKPVSDVELLKALFAPDRARAFKILLARQFNDMDGLLQAMAGGDKGSTLITERNKRALEVLRTQLALGHKRMAIFYGAGHMADLEQRLMADFDLHPVAREWLNAWDLRPEPE